MSGVRRSATGHGAGLMLATARQRTPFEPGLSRPVVVYCPCEITSLRVTKARRAAGVSDVRALTGGSVECFKAGNPVEPLR